MNTSVKAHFDGRVFVPDEPVELPVDERVEVQVLNSGTAMAAFEESRRRVLALAQNLARGIGPRNWTREDLYER